MCVLEGGGFYCKEFVSDFGNFDFRLFEIVFVGIVISGFFFFFVSEMFF